MVNKKNRLKKCFLVTLFSMTSIVLHANENSIIMSKIWARQNGNCTEGYSFSKGNNVFAYTSTTGKRILGKYLLEKVSNFDRLKLTLYASADNRLHDCFSGAYDMAQKTIVLYVVVDEKNNLLKMSAGLTNSFFGFYSLNYTFTQADEPVFFSGVYNALVADMTAIQNNVQRAYSQQQMNKTNTSLSSSDMFSIMDKVTQERKNAQAIVDEKLKYTSPEKADEFRGQMIKDNWRRMDARTEQYKAEQIESNHLQEYNRQEDIQNDYIQDELNN